MIANNRLLNCCPIKIRFIYYVLLIYVHSLNFLQAPEILFFSILSLYCLVRVFTEDFKGIVFNCLITLWCIASVHDTHGQGAIKFWLYATIAAAIPLGLAWRNAQHHIEEEDHEERPPFVPFQFMQNRTRVRDLSLVPCPPGALTPKA